MKSSQNRKLKQHLLSGKSVSIYDPFVRIARIGRLAARIRDLKDENYLFGGLIKDAYIRVNDVRCKCYWIDKEDLQEARVCG